MKYVYLINVISVKIFTFIYIIFYLGFNINIKDFYFASMFGLLLLTGLFTIINLFFTKKINILFSLIFLFMIILFLEHIRNNLDGESLDIIILYCLWSLPASLSGLEIKYINEKYIRRFSKFVFTIAVISMLIMSYRLSVEGINVILNSEMLTMQSTSYLCAFTIGLGLFLLSLNMKLSWKIVISFTLIPVLFALFKSGGRGGAILLFAYIIWYLINILKGKQNFNSRIFNSLFIISIVSILIYIILNGDVNSRIFSYINDEGIDLGQSSGRDFVYHNALDLINQHLFLGHGLFYYYPFIGGTPHNIILEILLIAGILGLIIFIIIFIFSVIKFIKLYDGNIHDKFFIFIFIYPLVFLQFSGNFLIVSELWFCVFYFLSRLVGKKNEN